MNAEQLLQNFDRIAESPGSIAHLRRFILDLAVRGKLVEQDSNDEPASELLKRIQVEKERLLKEGKTQKGKPIAPLHNEDCIFTLPKSWKWSQLAQIGIISPRNDADRELLTSFVSMPLISAGYGTPHKHEIRAWGEIKSGYTHFAEGDVGLAKITPCFENGKSTVFRNLTGGIGSGTTELHIVRPLLINADYVLLFLKCSHFIQTGIFKMTGTAGQKRVSSEYFACSPFPLPPLAEQNRIVAKVDELMGLCDRLETAQKDRESQRDRLVASSLHHLNQATAPAEFRDRAQFYFDRLPKLTTRSEHIKQLRQTILNLAVCGKLVPQDPNDEPASELLKEIETERKILIQNGLVKKSKQLPVILQDDIPFNLPQKWEWVRLGNLSLAVTSGSRDWAQYYSESGAIFLRMGNLSRGSYLLRLDSIQRVTPPINSEGARTKLEADDILVSITGEVGLLGLIPANFGEAYINQHTCLVRLASIMRHRFIPEVLKSQIAQNQFNSPQRGIKNSFRLTDITEMLIPLPPLAEQRRIVAKVDELMGLCDRLEAQISITETDSRRLLESLLNQARSNAA